MSELHKPIHAEIWSPLDKSIFKWKASDPATCKVFYCSMADTCPLLKKKQCINDTIIGPRCVYGYVSNDTGPTKRAKKCYAWVQEQRKKYGHLIGKIISSPPNKMAHIGEWVYVPYSHLDMNANIPIKAHSSLFISGSPFIKFTDFTIDTITKIVNFRPYSLAGGEITDYQLKEVPKFLSHLSEVFPLLYKQLLEANPQYVEKYKLTSISYIGRKALLKTINPSVVEFGKHTFNWDGTQLKSIQFDTLWIDIVDETQRRSIDKIDVTIVPSDKTIVKIVSNDQINPDTIFVD